MSAQIQVILIAAGCTSAVSVAGIGLMRLLRRASLRLSLQVGSAVAVLAIVAGTLGTAETMFISAHDLGVVVMICVVAGIAAFGFCWLLGRQVETSSTALRHAARSLSHETGGYRSPDGPMSAELAALSRELTATALKLAESRQRERRLEQSRRQLVAWVSHDLRTPLARLGAMAEALQDGIATDPGRYHGQIRAEVARLTGMVDDLFELSRIQAGSLQLTPDRIDLRDLISDAVAGTEALAQARGVRLAGEGSGPLLVHADPRELSRALANLLINAVQHTPAGGIVHVAATPGADGALLTVSDGCGGIPDDELDRIFDMGWRGTRSRTPGAYTGAGLGLAIVRGVIDAHHGQVSVANTRPGCRFTVRLPLLAAAGEADSDPGRASGDEPGPKPEGLLIPGL